ncbi:YcbX family protein [Celerinatantimonas sp. MCCC 1A17872]|uniref:YcbX family protein n=1 Tax=Celerinatantimonas sp. MCCC 1A17872 TaxID=3177514 RepID=UPI0038C7C8C3
MRLEALFNYPLKGCRANPIQVAELDSLGIRGDRRFMAVNHRGQFVNGKTFPKLVLVNCQVEDEQSVIFSAPNMPELKVDLTGDDGRVDVRVWRSDVNAKSLGEKANSWISDFLGGDFRLCFYDQNSHRQVNSLPEYPVSFSDSAPVLVASRQSLEALNAYTGRVDKIEQFRPNIVIDADSAFAEETWQRIRIGDVELLAVKACARCPVINTDVEFAQPDPNQEPLRSLTKLHRRVSDGKVIFGQYFVVTRPGQVARGDKIEVLQSMQAQEYQPLPDEEQGKYTITFEPMTQSAIAAVNDTILEVAENAGIALSSSCRGGSCGACRVKLISGDVEVGADYALTEQQIEQGYILACSCFARSDVVISLED